MKSLKKYAGIIAGATALLAPLAASAITLLPPCTKDGNCGITDILVVFVNFAEFLLGVTGAVALVYFVYGGFVMLMSAGRAEEVKKGQTILRSAVIGIAIIFLSGVIVRFTTKALTGGANKTNIIGESCKKDGAGGIYVSIPAGYTNPADPGDSYVGEEVLCVKNDNCNDLNEILKTQRNRPEGGKFRCIAVDDDNVSTCVRGLCGGGSSKACCLPK